MPPIDNSIWFGATGSGRVIAMMLLLTVGVTVGAVPGRGC